MDSVRLANPLFNRVSSPDCLQKRRARCASGTGLGPLGASPSCGSDRSLGFVLDAKKKSFGILVHRDSRRLSKSERLTLACYSTSDDAPKSPVHESLTALASVEDGASPMPISETIITQATISEVSSNPASLTLDPSMCGTTLDQEAPTNLRLISLSESHSQEAFQPKWFSFAKTEGDEKILINRCINAFIIGAAASAALTQIITVDRDVWRGWTFWEVVRNIPIDNWLAYEASLQSNPVLAKMCISGTVYTLGDWSAQCCEGRGILDFDRGRMLRSGTVGFLLHGSLSHYYYHFCEWLFPFQGWWVVPAKVAFDQTIWSGIWNSIYYATIGLLRLESPTSIIQEIKSTFFSLLVAGWKLWPFAHIITYGFIPVEQRLLWVDMVELVWVTILSMMSNEKAEARKIEDGAVADTNGNEIQTPAYAVIQQTPLLPNGPSTQDSVLWSPNMVDQMVVKDVKVENVDSM